MNNNLESEQILNLFLLMSSLSQLNNRETINSLFIEGIRKIFNSNEFFLAAEKGHNTAPLIDICTVKNHYGYLGCPKSFTGHNTIFSILENTTQMLAVVLEKLEQQKQLTKINANLEKLVAARTKNLEESKKHLQKSNKQKEILINELYHRTKNTLSTIAALINLSAAKYPENEDISHIVEANESRIQTIALVHQMLIDSSDLNRISSDEYLHNLVTMFCIWQKNKETVLDVQVSADDIPLSIESAVPLGLILNELISNSLQHAFTETKTGIIHVEFTANSRFCTLVYFDSGNQDTTATDWDYSSTLGMQLIKTLGEDQLQGEIIRENSDNFKYTLTFPVSAVK